MSCPEPARLVAASAGQDVAALAHAASCSRCRPAMRDELAMRDLARALPIDRLDRARRVGLAASVLAHADDIAVDPAPARLPMRARVRGLAIATAAMAAAAAVAIAVERADGPDGAVPAVVDVAPADPSRDRDVAIATVEPPPRTAPRDLDGAVRRIALSDGIVEVDTAVVGGPIAMVGDGVEIRATDARLEASAKAGVVLQVHVFAGTAVVRTATDSIVVTAGETWIAPPQGPGPAPVPTPAPAASGDGAAAFRDGWAALRAGDHARAATLLAAAAADSTFAEDARFWSAIASDRAGDAERAIAELVRFVAAFPRSPRVGEAHLTLARLYADRDPDAAARHRAAAAGDADPAIRQAASE